MPIPKVVADTMRSKLEETERYIRMCDNSIEVSRAAIAKHVTQREAYSKEANEIRQFLEALGEPVEVKDAHIAPEVKEGSL
jgi:pyrroline-5-carboxylate reductase